MDTCLAQMENLKIGACNQEPEPVTGVAFSCDTPGTHTGGQPCRLITVAPEIRNKIYELALYDNNEGLVDLRRVAEQELLTLLSPGLRGGQGHPCRSIPPLLARDQIRPSRE
ncbi:hypothetical protein LTR22_025240 [Elasticomyces elasticus]|nr:hypothetical protein LTR22_025240 [Elasticomyces elasticus]